MRTIDANELKDHIKYFTGMFTDEGFMVDLHAVLRAIEAAPTIDQYGTWILCSERLPKEAEEYHVTQYNKNAVTEYCDGYRTARIFFDDNGWWDDIDVLAGWKIIAWMPFTIAVQRGEER